MSVWFIEKYYLINSGDANIVWYEHWENVL